MNEIADNKYSIIQLVLPERERIASHGVKNIGLFGSFVRGEQNASIDIDILVEFMTGKHTFDNFIEVAFLLEDLFGQKSN